MLRGEREVIGRCHAVGVRYEAAHGAGVFHRAAIEDGDVIAERREFAEDVGADEDRLPEPAQLFEDFHEFDACARIEPAGRFIEQQQIGIMDEHARERDTLLHAARETADEIVLATRHVCERQHVGDDFVALRLPDSVGRAEEIEVLEDGHLPVHREVIRHEADLAACGVAMAHDVEPEDRDRAAGLRLQQRGEDFQRGRLARAVRPHEAVDRLAVHGEGHAAQGLVGLVAVREIADVDDRWVGVHWGNGKWAATV